MDETARAYRDRWKAPALEEYGRLHDELMQRIADAYDLPLWVVDWRQPVPPRWRRWTWRVGRRLRRVRRRLSL